MLGQAPRDLVRDGEAGSKARRFDAEQVDQTGNAVRLRPLDDEIFGWPAGRLQLGPDAGVTRLQRTVAQVRVVAADGGVERLRAAHVDVVVDGVDPLHVRPEA